MNRLSASYRAPERDSREQNSVTDWAAKRIAGGEGSAPPGAGTPGPLTTHSSSRRSSLSKGCTKVPPTSHCPFQARSTQATRRPS